MTTQELAAQILKMIDQHKRENAAMRMNTQWRERGKIIDQIEGLCFREAIKDEPAHER